MKKKVFNNLFGIKFLPLLSSRFFRETLKCFAPKTIKNNLPFSEIITGKMRKCWQKRSTSVSKLKLIDQKKLADL